MASSEKLKKRPPLQAQTASAQNVLQRPQSHHPFSPLQPVSACTPGWTYRSNTNTVNNSLSLYASPATPAPYSWDRNWSVSSAPLPPVPMPMPHYPSSPGRPRRTVRRKSCPDLSRVVSQTVELLANETAWERGCVACGEDVHGTISRKLDQIITLIDEGLFNRERDLGRCFPPLAFWIRANCSAFSDPVYDDDYYQAVPGFRRSKHLQNAAEYFSKVYLYYNSRLPANLPPLKLYVLVSAVG